MGQRGHALGLRFTDNSSWDGVWFAPHSSDGRSARVHRDYIIREWLEKALNEYGVLVGRIFVQESGGDPTLDISVEYYFPRGLRHWSWRRRYTNRRRRAGFRWDKRRKALFRLISAVLQRGLGNRPVRLRFYRLDSLFRSNPGTYDQILQNIARTYRGQGLQGRESSDIILIYLLSMVTRNPHLLLQHAVHQLESTRRHWGVFHRTRELVEHLISHCFWVKGARFRIAGRVIGRLRKSSAAWQVGVCSLNSLDYQITVGQRVAYTKYGTFGLTLWVSHHADHYFTKPISPKLMLSDQSPWSSDLTSLEGLRASSLPSMVVSNTGCSKTSRNLDISPPLGSLPPSRSRLSLVSPSSSPSVGRKYRIRKQRPFELSQSQQYRYRRSGIPLSRLKKSRTLSLLSRTNIDHAAT